MDGSPVKYRSRAELRRLWERRKAGERTADLAAEIGISANWLCRAWREHCRIDVERHEFDERRARFGTPSAARIYSLRFEGATYREIAEALGMEDPPGKGARLAHSLLRRYCDRAKVRLPVRGSGPRPRRCGACGAPGHDRRTCRRDSTGNDGGIREVAS